MSAAGINRSGRRPLRLTGQRAVMLRAPLHQRDWPTQLLARTPELPSAVNDSHQQRPANMKLNASIDPDEERTGIRS